MTHKSLDGHYDIINMDQLRALPQFDWSTFYHMPEVAKVGAEEAARQSQATGGPIKQVEPVYIPYIQNAFTVADVDAWR